MNTKFASFRLKRLLMAMCIALFCTTGTYAQNYFHFHDYSGDHLWSNPENWTDGLKPTDETAEVGIHADVIIDEDADILSLMNLTICNLTLQSVKKLTVRGTLSWTDGDFILEDGAQLLHQEYAFHAKVLKKIAAYDEDHNLWNLIASPVQHDIIPSMENGFLTDIESAYALFAFNEEDHEWVNFKETPFAITNEHGYLYANAFDTTLVFEGYIRSVAAPAVVNLSYHPTNNILAGCNFVGNPFPCNAFVDKSYYTLNEDSNSLIAVALSSHTPITPCMGIIVKADEASETLSFRHESPLSSENHGYIEITAAKSDAQDLILDQALLSYNDGDDLAKFALFENSPRVYFTQDNKDFAILSVDSIEAQPVRFKAEENGSYTLHIEPKDREVEFLHLIDNITGNNVDLLVNPDYTFTASTNDYASRFKLIFRPDYGVEEFENHGFAYYANEAIYINGVETQDFASLQIVDLTGRIVYRGEATDCVSTGGWTAGVYVLRLTSDHAVRTQKIIIE